MMELKSGLKDKLNRETGGDQALTFLLALRHRVRCYNI